MTVAWTVRPLYVILFIKHIGSAFVDVFIFNEHTFDMEYNGLRT